MQKISTVIEEINKTKYSINEEYDFETTKNPILKKLKYEFDCNMTLYDKNNIEVDDLDSAKSIYFGFRKNGDYADKLSSTSMNLQKDRSFERIKEMIIKKICKPDELKYYQLFKKLADKLKINIDPYHYGFGSYTLGGHENKKVMSMLDELGIKYSSKFSDERYVHRMIFSKTKANIDLIEKIVDGSV